MFGRDRAIDPVEEAKKVLRDSEARHHVSSTEFARDMLDKAVPPRAAARPAPAVTLAKHGKPLTPEQLAALEKLGEAQKAMAQKVAKGAAWIPRIIITLVVLFILRDMIPDVISLLKSLVAGAP